MKILKFISIAIASFGAITNLHQKNKSAATEYAYRSQEPIQGGVRYHVIDVKNLTEGDDYYCQPSSSECKISITNGTNIMQESETPTFYRIDVIKSNKASVAYPEPGTFTLIHYKLSYLNK